MELVKIHENTEIQRSINKHEGALVSHKNKLNYIIISLKYYVYTLCLCTYMFTYAWETFW